MVERFSCPLERSVEPQNFTFSECTDGGSLGHAEMKSMRPRTNLTSMGFASNEALLSQISEPGTAGQTSGEKSLREEGFQGHRDSQGNYIFSELEYQHYLFITKDARTGEYRRMTENECKTVIALHGGDTGYKEWYAKFGDVSANPENTTYEMQKRNEVIPPTPLRREQEHRYDNMVTVRDHGNTKTFTYRRAGLSGEQYVFHCDRKDHVNWYEHKVPGKPLEIWTQDPSGAWTGRANGKIIGGHHAQVTTGCGTITFTNGDGSTRKKMPNGDEWITGSGEHITTAVYKYNGKCTPLSGDNMDSKQDLQPLMPALIF